MTLKAGLGSRPVIYEIVPPRRDTSRFATELRGVESVLHEGRIVAINIPELINRRAERGEVVYSPATIPPEEYAMMIRDYKEPMVNFIAPRMEKDALLKRARKVLVEYKIPNLVLVGRERTGDRLPGPEVVQAFELVSGEKPDGSALGGICIFSRESPGAGLEGVEAKPLGEARRAWLKQKAGCDFFTSQIVFESEPALKFLREYQSLCGQMGTNPRTIFISITTVPSPSIVTLLEALDVAIPPKKKRELLVSPDMGRYSVHMARDVFGEIISGVERDGTRVPLGLQIEQVGVNSGDLSLELLDAVYPIFRGC